MSDPVSAVLGVAGSLFGASQAAKAQKEAAAAQMAMAAPYLKEAKLALPRLRALAQGYYAPRVGKDNPLLMSQHLVSLGNIQRTGRVGMGSIAHQYGMTGNTGRARGEKLRLADQLLRSQNQENLGYAQAQQAYRDNTAAQYQSILSSLIGAGSQGLQYGQSALQAQGNATAGFWDTFGRMFGVGGQGNPSIIDLLKKKPPQSGGTGGSGGNNGGGGASPGK